MQYYRVRKNGRFQRRLRTLAEVLREARAALDERHGSYAIRCCPDEDGNILFEDERHATTVLSYGRVRFNDGSVLDGLDENLRTNTRWV